MRRVSAMVLVLGLVFGAVTSAQAKKSKPVKATLYLHGTETLGEVDLANNFGASYNKMSTAEPTGEAPKSLQFTTWTGDPAMWNDCAGSYLLPVWTAPVSGRVVGDIKVTLHTLSAPRAVTVQVWPDLMTQTCASNDVSQGDYPTPAAEATVDLPAGPGVSEVVLEKVNFKAVAALTVMILPNGPVPGRVLYDSPDFASSLEFSCIPKSGKTCTE
jgi:hypothetical protein